MHGACVNACERAPAADAPSPRRTTAPWAASLGSRWGFRATPLRRQAPQERAVEKLRAGLAALALASPPQRPAPCNRDPFLLAPTGNTWRRSKTDSRERLAWIGTRDLRYAFCLQAGAVLRRPAPRPPARQAWEPGSLRAHLQSPNRRGGGLATAASSLASRLRAGKRAPGRALLAGRLALARDRSGATVRLRVARRTGLFEACTRATPSSPQLLTLRPGLRARG